MRPKQWLKNILLFAALVFSNNMFNVEMILLALQGFVVFCLVSSAGYIYNDLKDIEADRLHPKKRFRPLAAGELSPTFAVAFMIVTGIGALAAAWVLNTDFFFSALGYLAITLSYTFFFKPMVILDVMGITAGFIVRAVAGALVISVPISPWFVVCTAFFALFLAINKRLSELKLLQDGAGAHRKNLQEYSPEHLKQMLNLVASCTVMSYALYTFGSSHKPWLMATLPFVIYGIFRWQYLVEQKGEGGAPVQTFLRDRPLQIDVVLYVVTAIAAIALE